MSSSTPKKLPLRRSSSNLVSPKRNLPPRGRNTTPRKTPPRAPRNSSIVAPPLSSTKLAIMNSSDSNSNCAGESGEEGIQVAIRMRPLNNNEEKHRRVWKVLSKHKSVAQTTIDGQPLPERIMGRNFFSYDKTFGESTTTREVYNNMVKGIVTSVVSGLNGTIFAYGQTSSGKTYTMQGSGTIAQGSESGAGGGIVHMAAADIFQHIQQATDRIFLVRVSFLEIYNEDVRDLLAPGGENKSLAIREDPHRGVFVPSHEEIVTDMTSLLQILFDGDKARAFAATAMNERSSRSHTIFRVTIESREKQSESSTNEDEDEDEFSAESSEKGSVLISTLNLVDLAGSESVRHTGATGDRLKEGAMINQSLLTLSRVIGALGSSNNAHINFRDSKLTRILQPSLEGNARMAVVCCATPSELYLEETRSTLAFAARAKLVKTNAKKNEIMDDRSLIRRLQKELAEARRDAGKSQDDQHLQALQKQAASAGTAAKEAEEKLRRLQSSLLNSAVLFSKKPLTTMQERKRRRFSHENRPSSPLESQKIKATLAQTLPPGRKKARLQQQGTKPVVEESQMLRLALHSKTGTVRSLEERYQQTCDLVKAKETEIEMLRQELEASQQHCDDSEDKCNSLESESLAKTNELAALTEQLQAVTTSYSEAQSSNESLRAEVEGYVASQNDLKAQVEGIVQDSKEKDDRIQTLVSERDVLTDEMENVRIRFETSASQAEELRENLQREKIELTESLASASASLERESTTRQNSDKEIEMLKSKLLSLETENRSWKEENSQLTSSLGTMKEELTTLKEQAKEKDARLASQEQDKEQLGVVIQEITTEKQRLEETNDTLSNNLNKANADLETALSSVQSHEQQVRMLSEKTEAMEQTLEETRTALVSAKKEAELLLVDRDAVSKTLEETKVNLVEREWELDSLRGECTSLNNDCISFKAEISRLEITAASTCTDLTSAAAELANVRDERDKLSTEQASLTDKLRSMQEEYNSITSNLSQVKEDRDRISSECEVLKSNLVNSSEMISEFEKELSSSKSKVKMMEPVLESALAERKALSDKVASLCQDLDVTKQNLDISKDCVDEMTQSRDEVIAERDGAIEQLEEAREDLARTRQDFQKLVTEHTSLKDDHDARLKRNEELSREYEALQEQHTLSVDQLQQTVSALATSNERCLNLEAEKEQQSSNITSLEAELMAVKEEKNTMSLDCAKLSEEQVRCQSESRELSAKLDEVNKSLEELMIQKNLVVSELEQATVKIDSLQTEISDLYNQRDVFTATNDQLSSSVDSLKQEINLLSSAKLSISAEQESLSKRLQSIAEEKEALQLELEVMKTKLATAESALTSALSEQQNIAAEAELIRNGLCSAKEELAAANQREEELSKTKTALATGFDDLQSQLTVSKENSDRFAAENEALSTKLEALSSQHSEQIRCMSSAREALQTEVEEQKEMVEFLENEKLRLSEKVEALTQSLNDSETGAQSKSDEMIRFAAEFEAMEDSLNASKQQNDSLEKSRDQLSSDLEKVKERLLKEEEEKQLLTETVQSIRDELESKVDETATLSEELDDVKLKLEDTTAASKELREKLEKATLDLTSSQADCKDRGDELISLHDLLESSNNKLFEVKEVVQRLENEKDDLQRQLHDSKQQTLHLEGAQKATEARLDELLAETQTKTNTEITAARQEIEQLEKNLEDTRTRLKEAEEAFRVVSQERDEKAHALRSSQEHLRIAETASSYAISSPSSSNITAEVESLRDENALLKSQIQEKNSALSQMDNERRDLFQEADREIMQLKQEKEALERSLQRVESDAYSAREMISDLREEGEHNLSKVLEHENKINLLEAEKTRVERSTRRKEREKDSEIDNLRKDVKRLQSEVDHVARARRQSDEKLHLVQKELEHSNSLLLEKRQEVKSLVDQLNNMDVDRLKTENKDLREQVQQLSGKIAALMSNAKKDSSATTSQAEELEAKIDSLSKEILSKNERIKKLEKTKLTKDKLEHFQKIKRDNGEYKKKLEEAEKKLKVLSATSASPNTSEVAELQFANGALEKKLRKYIAHSQRLEDEKDEIRKVLRSSKVGLSDGDGIVSSVIELSDRIASLPQQVSAGGTDRSDLELLHIENKKLKNDLAELKLKVEEFCLRDAESQQKLSDIRSENKDLAADFESTRVKADKIVNEKRKEVQYLEQENLKLMMELKEHKRSIQSLRAEMNSQKIDLQPISSSSSFPTSIKKSKASAGKSEYTHDKENSVRSKGNISTPARSSKKARPLSSRKEATSSKKSKRVARLGEVFPPDEENTQECQQS